MLFGPSAEIRTQGLLNPIQARYQTSPHPGTKEREKTFFVLALPIFPARLQASIVGRNELNFRVRNGNGWTLILINTNLFIYTLKTEQ